MTDTLSLPRPAARTATTAGLTGRILTLAYGVGVYAFFLATFLYVIGFVAGAVVPKHINSGAEGALWPSLLVNGAFLAAFAVQHMIMARPAFKRRWTKIISPAVERSTFVLVTCLILVSMAWQWRPLPTELWHVEGVFAWVLWALCGLGWLTVLYATFLIDHFELFGLRQTVLHALGRPITSPKFVERSLYRLVRHPLMVGFLLAFWATPVMTVGHLFFAAMCTGYIFVGTLVEERDLVSAHGESYLDYRRRVRGFLPIPRRAS